MQQSGLTLPTTSSLAQTPSTLTSAAIGTRVYLPPRPRTPPSQPPPLILFDFLLRLSFPFPLGPRKVREISRFVRGTLCFSSLTFSVFASFSFHSKIFWGGRDGGEVIPKIEFHRAKKPLLYHRQSEYVANQSGIASPLQPFLKRKKKSAKIEN